jgi:hypothetical protein
MARGESSGVVRVKIIRKSSPLYEEGLILALDPQTAAGLIESGAAIRYYPSVAEIRHQEQGPKIQKDETRSTDDVS